MSDPGMSLQAHGLVKSYLFGRVGVPVLKSVSLHAKAGAVSLICGPSGCGKSTLLAILSGLLRPDEGEVISLGRPLSRCSGAQLDRHRRDSTGFIFQGFNLFPALTALEQVMLPLHYLGLKGSRAEDRARQALNEVDMDHRMNHRPALLSGGEQQRVAIARALAKQPRLLFADEPTSALDRSSGANVIELLHSAARRHQTAVVCVSHDPRLIDHADHVYRMEDGKVDPSVRETGST